MTTRPIAVDVKTAAEMLSLAAPTVYLLISRGTLPARKSGRRTLVLVRDLDAYAEGLPLASAA